MIRKTIIIIRPIGYERIPTNTQLTALETRFTEALEDGNDVSVVATALNVSVELMQYETN